MARRGDYWGTKGSAKKVDARIFDELAPIHPDSAGIDIGSAVHYVSVPDDRDEEPVRTFGCYTPDLQAMAAWLKECRIRTVVMESTGVYWVSAYRVLEEHGFEVQLVDAHHAKNVPGRKTDVWDCRWLRQLHTFGLLRGCFIPPKEIQVVRAYWRHRTGLVEACAQQIHLMHKALEQMNVQVHKALTDITGVTGMSIIRAIVAGERNPQVLSKMRCRNVKKSEEEIAKALTGNYAEEHLFALQQALEAYDFYHRQMEECDKRIEECMARFEDGEGPTPRDGASSDGQQRQGGKPRKNQAHFDLGGELKRIMGVDLTKIEGIDALTAQVVFSEIGADMSAFASEKHFASWLAVCPNNRITGGRVRSRRTRPSQNRVKHALCVAAQSLNRSKGPLGEWYRRKKGQAGPAKAITAVAHKLARIIYRMLRYGEEYVVQDQERARIQQEEQRLKRLTKQARKLGYQLVPAQTGIALS